MPKGDDTVINFYRQPAASEVLQLDLTIPTLVDDNDLTVSDYAPFSTIQFLNTGTTSLKVKLNQQRGYRVVPAGTIFEKSNMKINFISIENVSGSTAGEYYIQLDSADTDLSVLKDIRDKPARLLVTK